MTPPMAAKREMILTSDEVCRILEACAKTGVTEIEFGPLRVVRGKQTVADSYYDIPEKDVATHPSKAIEEPNHTKETAEALEQDEIRAREDQIAELLITDPLRAEEMIRDGELEEDDGPEEDI